MRYLFILFFLALASVSRAQNDLQDIRTTDITQLSSFDGHQFAFAGLHLGMTKQEAIDQLTKLKEFTWEFDGSNTKSQDPASTSEMRIYVNQVDDAHSEKKLELLYLIWDPGSLNLKSIVFFNDAAPMFKGNTQKLFTAQALQPKSPLLKFLKSNPVKETSYTTTWTYTAEHFALISVPNGAKPIVRFKLVE